MLRAKHTATGLQLRMPAALTSIDEAGRMVGDFLAGRAAATDLFAVRILLREALLNAVTHGSGENAAQSVALEVNVDTRGITLEVEDQGKGFDWRAREEQLDILGDGGRGLPLMRSYASQMSYNDVGNRVVLRRDFAAASAGAHVISGGTQ